jgi:uncharacterized protein
MSKRREGNPMNDEQKLEASQTDHATGTLYERLKADLPKAMKARDSAAVVAIRLMLAAIDHAGAVEVDTTVVPMVGRTADVPRRELSEGEVRALLKAEAEEHRLGAEKYERLGKMEEADRLRAEAEVFVRYLGN